MHHLLLVLIFFRRLSFFLLLSSSSSSSLRPLSFFCFFLLFYLPTSLLRLLLLWFITTERPRLTRVLLSLCKCSAPCLNVFIKRTGIVVKRSFEIRGRWGRVYPPPPRALMFIRMQHWRAHNVVVQAHRSAHFSPNRAPIFSTCTSHFLCLIATAE